MNTRFSEAIVRKKSEGGIPVIPDIKCVSPKEGDLLRGRDPVETAKLLAELGAPAVSVVTEPINFGGSVELLRAVAEATGLPALRKDFIMDADDLKRTKDYGADAVLLICAVQPEPLLFKLYEQTLSIGLEPLVEVHTKEEMSLVKELGARLVGINNRDILELEKDGGMVSVTGRLAGYAPKGAVLISESSIRSHGEAKQAIELGADAALVGTALWTSGDIRAFYTELCYGSAGGGTNRRG